MHEVFDFVICGGGAAGCVLAARLTEQPDVRVLVLEAGPDYTTIPAELEDGWGHPPFGNHDWGLTAHADATSRRVLDVSRGKVIGGSSTTNAAFALRGHPADYDGWAAGGHAGWAWNEVLPQFVKLERDVDFGDRPYHGSDGPIPIRRYRDAERSALAVALHDALAGGGLPEVEDHNAPGAVGVGPLPVNEVGGRRMGVASTYLAAARSRPNLNIRGDSLVDRVLIDGGRAHAVRTADGETVSAGRVIVSGGAYASPAILQRSGIGAPVDLSTFGIDVVVANDAVGDGLVDHPAVSVEMVYAGDVEPCRLMQTVATLRSAGTSSEMAPDLQLFGVGPWRGDGINLWMLAVGLLRPRSRGRVRLASADPAVPPIIELGYYNPECDDLERHVEGFRYALETIKTPELDRLTDRTLNAPPSERAPELEAHLRDNAWSYFHPVGSCAMGAVVDASGRVLGVEGLSVIDASVMPDIPSANTHLPTLMIAEHLAPLLLNA
jgi:choline dehydrogenase